MAESSNGDQAGLPEASLADSVKFVVAGLLPSVVRGLFSPRPKAMKLLTRIDADARATAVLQGIRRKHGGQGVRLLGGRIVTLWGPDAIREVVDHSAETYASDGGAKGKGMSHFQPDALTVSRGEEWKDRRAFNEHVLASSEKVHPDGDRIASVVFDEVRRLDLHGNLAWSDWKQLFDRITLRVIFGDAARGDHELTDALEKLMGEANRIVGLSTNGDFYEFYGMLERRLREPEDGCLLARVADAPQSDRTRVAHQIPHWMFAMRDTLGANTFRALALIVSSDDIEARVREEFEDGDLTDASFIQSLSYLEGCFQEAMRLWPTVPLIARETTCPVTLAGAKLDEGTQVMILNTFNHRDDEAIPDADRLKPERWQNGERDVRFNHLANGAQYCPGASLVSLIGKAAMTGVLSRWDFSLEQPELDASGDLPHMLDFFGIDFVARMRAAVT